MSIIINSVGRLVELSIDGSKPVTEEIKPEIIKQSDTHVLWPQLSAQAIAIADFIIDGDVPTDYDDFLDKIAAGFPKANTGNGGSGAFINLSDVPNSYAGAGGKAVRVNAGTNGLEFFTPGFPESINEDTTVDLNGHDFQISQGGNAWLYINQDEQNAYLQALNVSNPEDIGGSSFGVYSNILGNNVHAEITVFRNSSSLTTQFNESGVGIGVTPTHFFQGQGSNISWDFDDAAQTISLIAANGLILPSLAGGGTTGLSIDDNGKLIRTP
jgi:hypothetical protein